MKYELNTKIYINGSWTAGSQDLASVINPSDHSTIVAIHQAGKEQVFLAIESAQAAYAVWKKETVYARAKVLVTIGDRLLENKEKLAYLMAIEMGKVYKDALGEAESAAQVFYWFAEEIKRSTAEIIPDHKGTNIQWVERVPLGVVGLITPWNFPLNLVARKMAPALAAGNSVVLKPSSQSPLVALGLFEILDSSGLIPGLVNLVNGASSVVAPVLMDSPKVRKISFTGSTEIGHLLYEQSAPTLKKLSLELGGNAPFIVFDDAELTQAAQLLVSAKVRNAGQVCTNPNRVFVHEAIMEPFIDAVTEEIKKQKVGDPFADGVTVGPLVNEAAIDHLEKLLLDATEKGATVVSGGKRLEDRTGNFFALTLIRDVSDTMDIYNEEIFGPIISIIPFTGDEHVITQANGTPFGLAAYAFTQSHRRARKLAKELESGLVGINEISVSTTETPFGGVKYSGFGRENGKYGLEEYQDIKFINYGEFD